MDNERGRVKLLKRMSKEQRASFLIKYARLYVQEFHKVNAKSGKKFATKKWVRKRYYREPLAGYMDEGKNEKETTLGDLQQEAGISVPSADRPDGHDPAPKEDATGDQA